MKHNWWRALPVRYPSDSGGDGGAGGGAGGAAAGGEGTPAPDAGTPAPDAAPPARPDWLPETFWKDNKPDVEGLGKAYGELRTAFSSKEDKIREGIIAKMREGIPEKADGYKLEIKPDWMPKGFEAKPLDGDNPLVKTARELVHELGGKQEHFDKLAEMFVKWQVATWPNMQEQVEKLGEGGQQRIDAVDKWLSTTLGKDDAAYKAMVDGLMTADGIRGMEKIMASLGGTGAAPGGGGGSTISPGQAAEFMASPDYNHPVRGADMRDKVSAFIASGGRVAGYVPAR